MDKKQCIFNFVQQQIPVKLSTLGFTIIKSEGHFRKSYEMHDKACAHIVHQYLRKKYIVYPIGVDLREQEVIIENELPNYFAEKEEEIFCFDGKAKTKLNHFGWVNDRAARSYRKLAKTCNVPLYLNFVQVVGGRVTGKVGNCNIMDEPKTKNHKAWNGNIVWVFEWKEGFARI